MPLYRVTFSEVRWIDADDDGEAMTLALKRQRVITGATVELIDDPDLVGVSA